MKIYIQYSTDFHILAALSAFEYRSEMLVVLVGPKSALVDLLVDRFSFRHDCVEPQGFRVSILKIAFSFWFSKRNYEVAIFSPFVFPFYVFGSEFAGEGWPGLLCRTDEGIGSYASVMHYYSAVRREEPLRTRFYCFFKAFVKKAAVVVTRFLGVCEERYLFNCSLDLNSRAVSRFVFNLDKIGRLSSLVGKVVYVSQPGVEGAFSSDREYVDFINGLSVRFGLVDVVVKRHPADSFDYFAYGMDVVDGYPLEIFRLDGSIVVGFSSTALLMAKVLGGGKVYYVRNNKEKPFYGELSFIVRRLFDKYLESICL